jgi:predicted dinucleotide-utilizing enzyme
MRVLVVGAGRVGAKVVLQLRKNPSIEIITVDPRERPPAVEQGVLESVEYRSELSLAGIKDILSRERVDLVLVTTSAEDIARTGVPGLILLVEALQEELEASINVPIIAVSRTVS